MGSVPMPVSGLAPADDRSEASGAGGGGDWPRTTRFLPWAIAAFIVSLWLIPIDAIHAPIDLPIDSTIDRLELVALAFAWLVALGAAAEHGPRWRASKVNVAIAVFLAIATVSVLLNATSIVRAEEAQIAVKKLALLFCYGTFFIVVASSIRKTELSRLMVLMLVLASIAAVGTIIEFRTGVNYFYNWAAKLPLVTVALEPPDPRFGRPSIVGPAHHGLAIATMLAMMVPFAIVGLMDNKSTRRRVLYGLALTLLVAGSVATLRKTALVVPSAAILALVLYQPRRMARLLPLGLVILVLVQLTSPGALSGIRYQIEGGSRHSTEGRTSDYRAVKPDVVSHPLVGRGYGTYDPTTYLRTQKGDRHRVLDDQYLLLLIETGLLGLLAYITIGVTGIAVLHRNARLPDLARSGTALALIGSIAGFLVANVLFDTLAFPQVPYLFFCLLALGTISASRERLVRWPVRSTT